MGFAILTHKSGPVNCNNHLSFLQGAIVNKLICTPLKEGGVNRKHRYHTPGSKAGTEGYGVLLRYAYIIGSVRKLFKERFKPRTYGHCCGNGANTFILCGKLTQGFGKLG